MATPRPVSRASGPIRDEITDLGPLAELPGTWIGNGFNLIARPDFQNGNPFFLEVNGTLETLEFTRIGGDIPNRGSVQIDIVNGLHGVHYLQKVADCMSHGALHIEPGLWIHIPPATDPNVPDQRVVRQATIPHGDSLLAMSTDKGIVMDIPGPPSFDEVISFPFTDATIPGLNTPAKQVLGPPYTNPYLDKAALAAQVPECCLPKGLDLIDVVRNPALIPKAAATGQNIIKMNVFTISTAAVEGSTGILNIPFVVRNANAVQMDAIFWIETVSPDKGDPFMQLQYVQRVILNFLTDPANGQVIHWPHISVATLIKQ
jgi:hypothetical protein